MTDERPTIRPVNLGRLVELTHLCTISLTGKSDVESELGVSSRRARETILESLRIGLISNTRAEDNPRYEATSIGESFVARVEQGNWLGVSEILETQSPHYSAFLNIVKDADSIDPKTILKKLSEGAEYSAYDYNKTSVDVLGAWAQRLGVVQRNAFTGAFYSISGDGLPSNFPFVLLSVVEGLEGSAGINLRQRYISIPELREHTCERLNCARDDFDSALVTLAEQNIGRLELSGAPIDTGAKDARYGIKTIQRSGSEALVSTEQSSEQVMRGVEHLDKKYYYLAVYDRELTFNPDQ